jgi:hypothetical protein
MSPIIVRPFLLPLPIDAHQIRARRRLDTRHLREFRQEVLIAFTGVAPHDAAQGGVGLQRRRVDADGLPLHQARVGESLQHPGEDGFVRLQIDQPTRGKSSNGQAALVATPTRETRAGQTNPPPRDRALGIQAFEIADQQQPEVAPGRQPWPSLVSVESLAESLDELIKMVVVDDSIRARIEPVRGAPRQILCGQPHRRLSKAPWSFAHRHRRQCNRADRSCRSPITLTVHPGLLARQSQLEP